MTAPAPDLATARDLAVVRADRLRRPLPFVASRSGHKEWLHFCVLAPDVELLVNFSLTDPAGTEGASPRARLSLLVRQEEWDGDVDTFVEHDLHAPPGRIDLRFGRNTLRFDKGAYRIEAALQ